MRGGGGNLKGNTFYRIYATTVLSSSSCRVMDEVNVKKKNIDQKVDLRTKLEQFFENRVVLLKQAPSGIPSGTSSTLWDAFRRL